MLAAEAITETVVAPPNASEVPSVKGIIRGAGQHRALECQLVLACAAACTVPDQPTQIAEILKHELDWEYVLSVAGRNGVLPLLGNVLLRRYHGFIPEQIEDRLDRFSRRHVQTNLLMTSRLIKIMKLLGANDIPILPFKGPSLAMQAYRDLALRQFVDLDILVKPKHFDAAVSLLSEDGYSPASRPTWFTRKALFFTHKKDVVLTDEESGVNVELHWKLSGSHFSMPFEISSLWGRLDAVRLGGTEVPALQFKDLFVYLCLHGSRHEWERLAWLCDLNELIRAAEGNGRRVDWHDVHRHARDHGCERVVELGLFLLDEFFGVKTEIPGGDETGARSAFKEIARQVAARNFSPTRIPSLKRDKYLYLLSLQEKRTHRVKLYLVYLTYYLRLLMTPNSMDKTIFHLPGLFYPLYFILRPIRLAVMYVGLVSVEKSPK